MASMAGLDGFRATGAPSRMFYSGDFGFVFADILLLLRTRTVFDNSI